MAGHSKWAQIKRQKAVTDAKRSAAFSRHAKAIQLAARKGENPDLNVELRNAVEKAKADNMPLDNIERAIKKGSGKMEGVSLEAVRYEAYGPGGVAILIEGITDSKNRTTAEIKHLLSKHGCSLAELGAALWAFEKVGDEWKPKATVPISEEDAASLDQLLETLDDHDDVQEIYTNAE